MSFNVFQFKKFIIEPILKEYNMYSESAVNLLSGTCAQESKMGTYLRQYPTGPAFGVFQMEKNTHDDIWQNYILYKPFLKEKIETEFDKYENLSASYMIGNLWYATLICRIHYFRVSKGLPDADNIEGLAVYWKQYYNTVKGKGKTEEFIMNYNRFITDE